VARARPPSPGSSQTYGFYSIATDAGGNVEAPKSIAETSTLVISANPDFASSATLTSFSVIPSTNPTITLTVRPMGVFNPPTSFSCSGLPNPAPIATPSTGFGGVV
jgi:hypothetical protein